jgi:type I restriction enzyme M protein
MVEDSLIAVISLPAGCFNPYSGVKTSILMLDKSMAKKTDNILFIKLSNDGFDLGAQRREIDKNDLPLALKAFNAYKQSIANSTPFDIEKYSSICLLVGKEKVVNNKDIVLSENRYVKGKVYDDSEWSLKKLSDITISMHQGINTAADKVEFEQNGFPILQSRNITSGKLDFENMKYLSSFDWNKYCAKYRPQYGDILLTNIGTIGRSIVVSTEIAQKEFLIHWNIFKISADQNVVNPYYLKCCLDKLADDNYYLQFQKGGTVNFITKKTMEDIEIPLPPLEVQEEIVREIEGYQKIIDGAKMVVENYKPTIKINPEWEMVELGEYVIINNGQVLTEFDESGTMACIKVSDMNLNENLIEITTANNWINYSKKNYLKINSIIFPKRGAAIATNKKRITKIPCLIDNNCMGLTVNDESVLNPKYLFYFFLGFDLRGISSQTTIALINNSDVQSIKLPLPKINEQTEIVSLIEQEQQLVAASKQLISLFEQKIKDKINEVWGVREE